LRGIFGDSARVLRPRGSGRKPSRRPKRRLGEPTARWHTTRTQQPKERSYLV